MGRNGLFIMIVIILMSIGGYAMFRNKVDDSGTLPPANPVAAPEAPASDAPAPAPAN